MKTVVAFFPVGRMINQTLILYRKRLKCRDAAHAHDILTNLPYSDRRIKINNAALIDCAEQTKWKS